MKTRSQSITKPGTIATSSAPRSQAIALATQTHTKNKTTSKTSINTKTKTKNTGGRPIIKDSLVKAVFCCCLGVSVQGVEIQEAIDVAETLAAREGFASKHVFIGGKRLAYNTLRNHIKALGRKIGKPEATWKMLKAAKEGDADSNGWLPAYLSILKTLCLEYGMDLPALLENAKPLLPAALAAAAANPVVEAEETLGNDLADASFPFISGSTLPNGGERLLLDLNGVPEEDFYNTDYSFETELGISVKWMGQDRMKSVEGPPTAGEQVSQTHTKLEINTSAEVEALVDFADMETYAFDEGMQRIAGGYVTGEQQGDLQTAGEELALAFLDIDHMLPADYHHPFGVPEDLVLNNTYPTSDDDPDFERQVQELCQGDNDFVWP